MCSSTAFAADTYQATQENPKGSCGDAVRYRKLFRVDGQRALLARTPRLLDLAGSVAVPAQKRGTPWPEIRRRTREVRAKNRA